jgi:hypothetical protein
MAMAVAAMRIRCQSGRLGSLNADEPLVASMLTSYLGRLHGDLMRAVDQAQAEGFSTP